MPLPAISLGWAAAVAAAGTLVALFSGNVNFAPGACERLEPYLTSHIVGQELALKQISDAICDHLQQPDPARPLVLSLHGPPGVGKSMFHLLAAQALYNRDVRPGLQCPGRDCRGYKVLYGMDYLAEERQQQHNLLRASLLEHVRQAPESLLVVEEYDKLDCAMRGFFRQLLENGRIANVTLNRAVIVMESNVGYTELHDLLAAAGDRSKISAEEAQRVLKDMVFARWLAQACEERTDTLKMVGLVDFFLPFFPLERPHIRRLFGMRLAERSAALEAEGLPGFDWDDVTGGGGGMSGSSRSGSGSGNSGSSTPVIDFLTAKVDFEGPYPIEGAKEVGTIITRYVSRPVREWAAKHRQQAGQGGHSAGGTVRQHGDKQQQQQRLQPAGWRHRGRLRLTKEGSALVIEG